jgi:hypothetical protein
MEVADHATEVANLAREAADQATEVANLAREAADGAKEMTTCQFTPSHLPTSPSTSSSPRDINTILSQVLGTVRNGVGH